MRVERPFRHLNDTARNLFEALRTMPVHGYATRANGPIHFKINDVPACRKGRSTTALQPASKTVAFWLPIGKKPRPGREAKFYRLTRKGLKQLKPKPADWQRLIDAIGLILRWPMRCAMNWWKRISRRTQMEAQLEKELSFHLEQAYVAVDWARHTSGRSTTTSTACRSAVRNRSRRVPRRAGTRLAGRFAADTRYCASHIPAKAGFTVVALLILSLGIGATTVMFAVINSVLLRPLSYPEPDRLVTLRGFTEAFASSGLFQS